MENSDLSAIFWDVVAPKEEIKKESKWKKRNNDAQRLYTINEATLLRFINAERKWKIGAKALLLYLLYQYHGKGYNIDLINATDTFIKWDKKNVWLGRDEATVCKVRKFLETPPADNQKPLISSKIDSNRDEKWHFIKNGKKRKIKINHMINAVKEKDALDDTQYNQLLEKLENIEKSKEYVRTQQEKELDKEFLEKMFKLSLNEISRINGIYINKYRDWDIDRRLKLKTVRNLCNWIKMMSDKLWIEPAYNEITIIGMWHMLYKWNIIWNITYKCDLHHEAEIDYLIDMIRENKRNTDVENFTELMVNDNWEYLINQDLHYLQEWHYRNWMDEKDASIVLTTFQKERLEKEFWEQELRKAIKRLWKCLHEEYTEFIDDRWIDKNIVDINTDMIRFLKKQYCYTLLRAILLDRDYTKKKIGNYWYITEERDKYDRIWYNIDYH